MIWIAGAGSVLLLVLVAIGLVDLIRNRHRMETYQVVIWAIVIVLVPVIGLVSYLLWRLARSDSMQESMDYQKDFSGKSEPYPPIGR